MVDIVTTSNASWEVLTNGSILTAGWMPYTQVMGDWFWFILFLVTLILLYIRTESVAVFAAYTMLGSVLLIEWLPSYVRFIVYTLLVMGLALALWLMFGKKDS